MAIAAALAGLALSGAFPDVGDVGDVGVTGGGVPETTTTPSSGDDGTHASSFPTIDGAQPRDVDGDGKAEDLNGNGRADFDDLVTFLEHLDTSAVANNTAAFDFNGDGTVNHSDATTLARSL